MKTIKDLKIGDTLYCATLTTSNQVQVQSIEYNRVKDETKITWGDGYYAHATAKPTEVVLKNGENKYFYLCPEDAAFHQRTLREEHVQNCKDQLDQAFKNLQNAIQMLSASIMNVAGDGDGE